MIYYRLALRTNENTSWRWTSTIVTSLESVLGLIKLYSCVPKDRIRVFFATSAEKLNAMLAREHEGLASNSMTAAQFLSGQRISGECIARLESEDCSCEKKVAIPAAVVVTKAVNENRSGINVRRLDILDIKRLEMEPGTPGDHDSPYRFSLPASMPQTLLWLNLMLKVQSGELEP